VLSRQETAAPVEVAHLGKIALRLARKVLNWDPAKEEILGDSEAAKMLGRLYRAPWKLSRQEPVGTPCGPGGPGEASGDLCGHSREC
jgi:Oxidoreductase family, C-terminal alpha/beta domain